MTPDLRKATWDLPGPVAYAVPPKAHTITTTVDQGSDYAVISRRVKLAGLLERRRGYYAAKISITLALFAAGWVAFFLVGDSWYQIIVASVLAIAFTQVAFLGHDAGHRQVFTGRRANDLLGLICGDLLVGLSYSWWVDEHNRHHAHPNQEGADPDVADGGPFAFSSRQAGARSHAFTRAFGRLQAWLFFPMLTLEALNLHVSSVQALLIDPRRRYRRIELVLFTVHLAAYCALLILVLSPVRALVFVAIQQGIFGVYLGCSFAPNHKGMLMPGPEDKLDYLRRQVLTSRNVRGGRFTDLLLGGLNYQIEHHLFPNMPRPNLRRLQPIIKEFCLDLKLPYAETSLVSSYAIVLRHLNAVAEPLRG